MAFTRPTGRHRRPAVRASRTGAKVAGIAALTTGSVVGTLAAPAQAANHEGPDTGLTRVIGFDSVAQEIATQASLVHSAAEQDAAEAEAAARASKEAVKAKREAERKKEAKERAARAAERKRLNTFVLPIPGSYVSTGYHASSSLWSSGSHTGIDFHAASGTSVHAVGAGTVVKVDWGGAYGNEVVLRMHDGTYTQYGHLTAATVAVGQAVTAGQQIAISGATGNVTGPHLHFEARTSPEYGSDMDPLAYLRGHGIDI
ncbi:M23 family metallopeptidase [Streptomyces sp. NEAU-H3]|uniref:M23 family metallopeptidase n=1 Tax=Streptomyces sp. NEAU-H3 TaxID=2720636 RepID=UPI00143B78C6|nr:M23 family metallopeptidase [Streptomyces sp. NEAU-H3]NJA58085.1 M23 family metallopeptidase [Streptomyces sp. NEAU-H3]